jgi:hypothetical protein
MEMKILQIKIVFLNKKERPWEAPLLLLKNIFKTVDCKLQLELLLKLKWEILFWTVLYILNTKYPENIPNKTPIKYQLGSVPK